ncbi:MAG: glycerate kinase [Chthoniobacterales bacterium]
MRILVAPDKFKHSLSATDVAENIAAGLRDILPDAQITCMPIADGGEGTARAICDAARGQPLACEVRDPLGRIVTAHYCTIENGATAVMEMSEASGLWRLASEERDPLRASTYGTGEMLLDAARRGVREIIIGLGGSGTNDGGFGMARALGFRFFDGDHRELSERVSDLTQLAQIVAPNELSLPRITAAVDVRNPLLGERGATRIFGPQKGVTPERLAVIERGLARLSEVVGGNAHEIPGAGGAGGLGFGLVSFCRAEIRSGFDVVAERIGLRDAMRAHDVVITGEGRLDAQTLEGKGPAGVAQLARVEGKRVFAIVGAAEGGSELFDRVFVVGSIENAAALVKERARELARSLR